jgi:hypothetical protein
LIVMGLHGSPISGPRMGSVTYRVLCLAHPLLLAIPPAYPRVTWAGARTEDGLIRSAMLLNQARPGRESTWRAGRSSL